MPPEQLVAGHGLTLEEHAPQLGMDVVALDLLDEPAIAAEARAIEG